MEPFPPLLFPLICVSLCMSTLALIFTTFVISVSPVLWIIPAAFIATAAYHAVTFLISSGESSGSARLFSRANLAMAYALTVTWGGAFGVAVAYTVLRQMGKLKETSASRGLWTMVVPCLCSFFEILIMGYISMRTHEERRRIVYAEKWKWRPGFVPSHSKFVKHLI
ncbi:hypothetical protein BDZ94DRAFT_1237006 [Collybia nuda]|uniref:Uncharacterized protein n=1 Tax=Collybia nuda TaxID=64659 RepID=A0A9P6CIY0_9AGAR|nr:hypothetical protein BDZ94DRAFT_1237006 [Collybia nuda]